MIGVKRNPFVVIEGPDRVGKTTLTAGLSTSLNYRSLYSIPEKLASTRELIDGNDNEYESYFYYLMCNSVISRQISRLVDKTGIVLDRYIFSTNFYHKKLGCQFTLNENILFKNNVLQEPDLVIFLKADEEILKARVEDWNNKFDKMSTSNNFIEEYENSIINSGANYSIIDTSNLTIQDVLNQSEKLIKELAIIE